MGKTYDVDDDDLPQPKSKHVDPDLWKNYCQNEEDRPWPEPSREEIEETAKKWWW